MLYDLAVEGKFRPFDETDRADFLQKVDLNELVEGEKLKKERPLLLITSTSYTPDEDLGLLVQALRLYDENSNLQLPEIILVVTGAGPLKKQFLAEFAEFNKEAKKVRIEAKWLEIDDYPKMVASADLGICMHLSSSGLDLPMKVVDLFSCQVPVLAYRYPAITELVKPAQGNNFGKNDMVGLNGALF